MKTTVALEGQNPITVYPSQRGGICLDTGLHNQPLHLTEAEAGVLIFALEKAAEAARLAVERRNEIYRAKYEAKAAA